MPIPRMKWRNAPPAAATHDEHDDGEVQDSAPMGELRSPTDESAPALPPLVEVRGSSAQADVEHAPLPIRVGVGFFGVMGGCGNSIAVNVAASFTPYTRSALRSTFVNFAVATLILFGIVCVGRLWKNLQWIRIKRDMPWWHVPLPGIIGSSYVAASVALAPEVTYGTFIGFYTLGQVVSSLLCDHFSILGAIRKPLNVIDCSAAAVACAAVALSEGFNPSQAKYAWWATALLCTASCLTSVPAPFQALLNKLQAFRYGSPFTSAFVSFFFGTIFMGILSLLSLAFADVESNMNEAPWWCWFGGCGGVVFVTSTALCPKYLGASLYFVSVVTGQVGASMLFDATSAFPVSGRDVMWTRIVGLIVVVLACFTMHMNAQYRAVRAGKTPPPGPDTASPASPEPEDLPVEGTEASPVEPSHEPFASRSPEQRGHREGPSFATSQPEEADTSCEPSGEDSAAKNASFGASSSNNGSMGGVVRSRVLYSSVGVEIDIIDTPTVVGQSSADRRRGGAAEEDTHLSPK